MARNGKIASLPAHLREELNQRLNNGQRGPELLPWLNSLPETQAVLTRFDGKPVNASNLSDWRNGGYREWLDKQDRFHNTRKLADFSMTLAREAGGNLSEGAAAIVAGKLLSVLEARDDMTPEELADAVKAVAALRSGDQANIKLRQAERDLERKDRELANSQRRTAEMILDAANDARVRDIAASPADHSSKIEQLGQLMFGDDWKPANATSA